MQFYRIDSEEWKFLQVVMKKICEHKFPLVGNFRRIWDVLLNLTQLCPQNGEHSVAEVLFSYVVRLDSVKRQEGCATFVHD